MTPLGSQQEYIRIPVGNQQGDFAGGFCRELFSWADQSLKSRTAPDRLGLSSDTVIWKGRDLPLEIQLQTAWISFGEQARITSRKR
jgi:hypothetical protein